MNALQMVNEYLSRFARAEVTAFGATGSDSAIALRKINLAIGMIATHFPFKWLETNDSGEIVAVAGTAIYNTDAGVGHFVSAKHEYQGGGLITLLDREALEGQKADRTQTSDRGTPRVMCSRGKIQSGTDWLWRLEFYPVPDSNFDGEQIVYNYTIIPADLSATTDVSVVPEDFHWLVIDMAELLGRTAAVRAGGDQNQIDLYGALDKRVQKGLKQMVYRDGSIGQSSASWSREDLTV